MRRAPRATQLTGCRPNTQVFHYCCSRVAVGSARPARVVFRSWFGVVGVAWGGVVGLGVTVAALHVCCVFVCVCVSWTEIGAARRPKF